MASQPRIFCSAAISAAVRQAAVLVRDGSGRESFGDGEELDEVPSPEQMDHLAGEIRIAKTATERGGHFSSPSCSPFGWHLAGPPGRLSGGYDTHSGACDTHWEAQERCRQLRETFPAARESIRAVVYPKICHGCVSRDLGYTSWAHGSVV
jgi:hypothetical protein